MTTGLIAFLDEPRKPIRNPKTGRVGEPDATTTLLPQPLSSMETAPTFVTNPEESRPRSASLLNLHTRSLLMVALLPRPMGSECGH